MNGTTLTALTRTISNKNWEDIQYVVAASALTLGFGTQLAKVVADDVTSAGRERWKYVIADAIDLNQEDIVTYAVRTLQEERQTKR